MALNQIKFFYISRKLTFNKSKPKQQKPLETLKLIEYGDNRKNDLRINSKAYTGADSKFVLPN